VSQKEMPRAGLIKAALARQITNRQGAEALRLSIRLVAHCHLGLGHPYGRTGDRAKAAEHLTTAAAMYREMGMGRQHAGARPLCRAALTTR
jgi:hypothetical protein